MSTTFFSASYDQNADDLRARSSGEPFSLSSGDSDHQGAFRREAAFGNSGKNRTRKTEEENAETAQPGAVEGSSGSPGAGSERGNVYFGRSSHDARLASWEIFWTIQAVKEINNLPPILKDRIIDKMDWFVLQKNPLSFAKKLQGNYAGMVRFRVGDYRVICEVIHGEVRILRVLSVRNRKNAYG